MFPIAKILYGSQNYRLDSDKSDRDYKILVCPTWHDIVWKQTDRTHISDKDHESYWDVRNWFKEIMRGNPNAWELLWSVDAEYYSGEFALFCEYLRNNSSDILAATINYNTVKMWHGIANKCGEDKDDRKGQARKLYFYNVFKYLLQHNLKFTEDTWRSDEVSSVPRAIRYEGAPIDFDISFDELWLHFYISPFAKLGYSTKETIARFEHLIYMLVQKELNNRG